MPSASRLGGPCWVEAWQQSMAHLSRLLGLLYHSMHAVWLSRPHVIRCCSRLFSLTKPGSRWLRCEKLTRQTMATQGKWKTGETRETTSRGFYIDSDTIRAISRAEDSRNSVQRRVSNDTAQKFDRWREASRRRDRNVGAWILP